MVLHNQPTTNLLNHGEIFPGKKDRSHAYAIWLRDVLQKKCHIFKGEEIHIEEIIEKIKLEYGVGN